MLKTPMMLIVTQIRREVFLESLIIFCGSDYRKCRGKDTTIIFVSQEGVQTQKNHVFPVGRQAQ